MVDCVQIIEAESISGVSTHETAYALQVGAAAVA
jgi:hypothetical protein